MEYKTVWLSDLHLGARGCNARGLLDFLRRAECRTLYLVGDVVDLWSLKRERYCPQGTMFATGTPSLRISATTSVL